MQTGYTDSEGTSDFSSVTGNQKSLKFAFDLLVLQVLWQKTSVLKNIKENCAFSLNRWLHCRVPFMVIK